ncbi:MAG TPA: hypothetical protein DEO60_01275 [Bacteroidales bacterium]|jgi:hypothetical protein|nr:hypothetical protein [Bacteroidales bacterium]
MNAEIEKLINLTVATGEITERKRETIMRKAQSLGEDLDEVELILNGELVLLKEKGKSDKQTDSVKTKDDNKVVNINFFQIAMSFLNQYKILKYSLIFFLVCLGFSLLSIISTLLI